MNTRAVIFGLLASAIPFVAPAETKLQFPTGSVQGFEEKRRSDTFRFPIGPFANSSVETTQAEGAIIRRVWKTPSGQTDTLGLMKPLRQQLEDEGFTILYECETRECGGFDFRFETDVIEEPKMHVDLGDFRYLTASRTFEGKEEYVGLLVSRSPERGFIQVTKVGAMEFSEGEVVQSTKNEDEGTTATTPGVDQASSLADRLVHQGAVVLEGLEFLKGSADLSGNPLEALQELATYLADNPDARVVLVGHTDAIGSLERNVELSKKRAESVLTQLVETYGVDSGQLSAEGIGYLSPRATNTTEEGRELNRRVEVVLTSVR